MTTPAVVSRRAACCYNTLSKGTDLKARSWSRVEGKCIRIARTWQTSTGFQRDKFFLGGVLSTGYGSGYCPDMSPLGNGGFRGGTWILFSVANPYIFRVGHFGLPGHFVAWPELHRRFECCPESHSTSAILSTYVYTCLAMFCTSVTFTATAFPSPSLSFSVHISHSITPLPAPSPTPPPDSHMLPRLRCARFGTFAALTRRLNAFHFFVGPPGGAIGIASFCTFQRARKDP
jgi:hypothetical protein